MPLQFDAAEDVLKVHREDGKLGSPEEMWLACQQQVLQLNATGINFLEHTKEVRTYISTLYQAACNEDLISPECWNRQLLLFETCGFQHKFSRWGGAQFCGEFGCVRAQLVILQRPLITSSVKFSTADCGCSKFWIPGENKCTAPSQFTFQVQVF